MSHLTRVCTRASRMAGQCSTRCSGNSSTVIPSMPGPPLLALTLFQCRLAVFPLDDFFHQLFGNGRAFGPTVLHGHFGPFSDILQSFTPIPCHESQLQLVILPLGAHASRCLLATSFTSTSPVETVRAFVPCGTNTPSADFCRPVRMDRSTLSHDIVTDDRSPEVSPTVFDAQTAGFTFRALDGCGLRDQTLARPALTPQIQFLYISSRLCSALLSDPASRRRPCASLTLHLHQVG